MLGRQCRRRWATIGPALGLYIVLAGLLRVFTHSIRGSGYAYRGFIARHARRAEYLDFSVQFHARIQRGGGCTFLAKTFNSSLYCPKFSKKSQSADIGLMRCRCVRVTLLTVMSL